jgi:hypothetical protein
LCGACESIHEVALLFVTLITLIINGAFFCSLFVLIVRARSLASITLGFLLAHVVVSIFVVPHLVFLSISMPRRAPEPIVEDYWKFSIPIWLIDMPLLPLIKRYWLERRLTNLVLVETCLGGMFYAMIGLFIGVIRYALRHSQLG